MKQYDESKCLAALARLGRVNYGNKSIVITSANRVGIHTWGKIDYLHNYCGWHISVRNELSFINSDSDTRSAREAKRERKEHKLTNKRK